jgi:hypothetical protein
MIERLTTYERIFNKRSVRELINRKWNWAIQVIIAQIQIFKPWKRWLWH